MLCFPFTIPCNITNAAIGTIATQVVATTATITSTYLNTNYPNMTLQGKVTFTNVTDAAPDYLVFRKITAAIWVKESTSTPV